MKVRRALVTFIVVLAAALAMFACASQKQSQEQSKVQSAEEKPNIILILTDDMRKDELEYMPKTKQLIGNQGIEYSNAFVTTSDCCPSRASILRGQYAHNHRVLTNSDSQEGGFEKFESQGNESSTIATWLHDVGYKTALVGKYLNGYKSEDYGHIPSGWDEWYARTSDKSAYYDYDLSENGETVSYGSEEQDYLTDVEAEKAKDFIRRSASGSQPLFLYLAPSAPHAPFVNAPRHDGMFEDVQAPRPPSFNEGDVSDKPAWIQDLPQLGLGDKAGTRGEETDAGEETNVASSSGAEEEADAATEAEIDEDYRKRLRMLQAVDDMVEGVVNELETAGKLESTYLIFTSDNGYLLGEHRVPGDKRSSYEESIRVPLVVRGPSIPAGRTTSQVALNTDFAPTFADLGNAVVPSFVDGRSLKPTFASDAPSWRNAFLEEFWPKRKKSRKGQGELKERTPEHTSVRTSAYKLVDYTDTGERELYDLTNDPYELENSYETADQPLLDSLQSRLEALKACARESCRAAEDGP